MSSKQDSTLRLALCQIHTQEWDVEGNTARLMEGLEEAARQGAELAITPECALHGYGFTLDPSLSPGTPAFASELHQRTWGCAEPLDGPRIGAVRELAKRRGMDVVLGFAERGARDAKLYNSAAFIGREGNILWVYRKVHCRHFESAAHFGVFTPGDRFFVSGRASGDSLFRIGAFICFDREVAESARCLRALGAELIACPLATNTFDLFHPENQADNEMVTRVRAAENEVFIAVVNHAGRFNGGSFLVGPQGEALLQMGQAAEIAVLDAPLGKVAARYHGEPLGWMGWGYRRPDVYARYCGFSEAAREEIAREP